MAKIQKKVEVKEVKAKEEKVEDKQLSKIDMIRDIAGDIKGATSFDEKQELKFVSSRMVGYNRASILGGFPTGAIYEIHGPNAGGKTALGIEILCSAQQAGHWAVMHDHEKAANDKRWLAALGLDLSNCLYRNKHKDGKSVLTLEDSAQEINDMIISFNEGKQKGTIPEETLLYILFDSVAAACPKAKLQKGAKVGDANYGLTARLMSDWCQTLEALVGGSDVAIIFINQERVNVGGKPWEPKFKSFGGEALQFFASVRIRVNLAGKIKEKVNGEEIVVARKHKVKIEKNKLGYPEQEFTFYTSNGLGACQLGFDDVRSTLDEALMQGVIKKVTKTSYDCKYFSSNIVGERKVREFLYENQDILQKIKNDINELILSGQTRLTSNGEEEGDDDDES